ncbi:MAG: glycosyl hydrolase, partial [Gemmatimonadales bacterium]|nr:glycosyl hydrolase [Gemmatimonadales bacterium]
YYLKEAVRTRKAERQSREQKLAREGKDVLYPPWEDLKAEDREDRPAVTLTIRDVDGNIVRRVTGSTSSGLHRATWDFRYQGFTSRGGRGGGGPLAAPGHYTVSLEAWVDGTMTERVPPTSFIVVPLDLQGMSPPDREAVLAANAEVGELQRVVMGTSQAAAEAATRIDALKQLISTWPNADPALLADARALETRLLDLQAQLNGDPTMARRNEPAMPGITDKLQTAISGFWSTTMGPTNTQRRLLEQARSDFGPVYDALRQLVETDLPALEERVEATGAPLQTRYRLPRWQRP